VNMSDETPENFASSKYIKAETDAFEKEHGRPPTDEEIPYLYQRAEARVLIERYGKRYGFTPSYCADHRDREATGPFS